jgi:DNA-binding Lrp family transcriptional regulator
MDEKDIQILAAVAELGTGSPEKINEEIGIPTSTIHYRIQHLKEEGVIENDLFEMNLEKLGLSLTVITEVWAEFEEGYHNDVGGKLADIEGVNQVYFTMGETDFVVISHLTDRTMVQRLVEDLEAISEITRTSSKFAILTVKDEAQPLNDFSRDTLVEALSGLMD